MSILKGFGARHQHKGRVSLDAAHQTMANASCSTIRSTQRADDPRTVAYYVESGLQAHNVEFADEPMIEGGMPLAPLALAADLIAFDEP